MFQEKTTTDYRQEFQQIMLSMTNNMSHQEWVDVYRKLIFWDLELDKAENNQMREVYNMQRVEANKEFFKFIQKNYLGWLKNQNSNTTPTLSHNLFKDKVIPNIDGDIPTFFILIDNLRYDQWKMIETLVNENFRKVSED